MEKDYEKNMRAQESEMKNVCTTKSWANVCGGGCGIEIIYYVCDESREECRKHKCPRIE